MLQRIGMGMIVAIVSAICILAYDIRGHLLEHSVYDNGTVYGNATEIHCFLVQSTSDPDKAHLGLPSGLIALPYSLSAVAEMLVLIAGTYIPVLLLLLWPWDTDTCNVSSHIQFWSLSVLSRLTT